MEADGFSVLPVFHVEAQAKWSGATLGIAINRYKRWLMLHCPCHHGLLLEVY